MSNLHRAQRPTLFHPRRHIQAVVLLVQIIVPSCSSLRMHPAMSSATISDPGADMAIKLEAILIRSRT